ncbi:YqcI/YcgG family protein [Endozoicomonas acroporae]|uniref:YqcI/YcgG family protein n=1 Tax=Endozoicomonas acroporae TaxID=1701104 RepID=UPI003D7A720A
MFFSQDYDNYKKQHETGWDALNWVHSKDLSPWPSTMPSNPDSPEWSFCFNNIQLFINISSSDHKLLQSRNLGSCLTFVINARENFDVVANGKTKSGRLVRNQIRDRVRTFNNGLIPKELGFYGEEENLEWKQYQLSENDLKKPTKCPFVHKNNQ